MKRGFVFVIVMICVVAGFGSALASVTASHKQVGMGKSEFLSREIQRLQRDIQKSLFQLKENSNRASMARELVHFANRLELIHERARHAGLEKQPDYAKQLQALDASIRLLQEKSQSDQKTRIAKMEQQRMKTGGKINDLQLLKLNRLHEERSRHISGESCGTENTASGPEDLGSISGTIADAQSSAPLADVEIVLYDSGGFFAGIGYSDAAGEYWISDLPSGNYFAVSFNYQGYLDELYDNIACTGGNCDPFTGSPIVVAGGRETPSIDFDLDLGGIISGKVLDSKKRTPVVDASVYIFDFSGNFASYGFTDSKGRYSAGGLDNGSYFAVTSNYTGYVDELFDNFPCPFLNCDPTSGTSIPAVVAQETAGVDFALDLGGTITGKVIDSRTRLPIPDVFIYVLDAQGNYATSGYTNIRGQYSAGGLVTGNYFAQSFSYAGYVDEVYKNISCFGGFCDPTGGTRIAVSTGGKTRNINFALDPAGSIAGNVTEEGGSPLGGVDIYVFNSNGEFASYGNTDLDGNYVATGLLTGSYFVVAANYQGYLDELFDNIQCPALNCDLQTGTAVPVQLGNSTESISFQLGEGGSISGNISATPGSEVLPDVEVQLYDSQGGFIAYGYSDVDGNYTVIGLGTGNYFARTFNYGGYVDELFDNIPCTSCDVTQGASIPVTVGSNTADINFELEDGGSISGKVSVDGTADPLPDVGIEIFDSQGTLVSYGYSDFCGNYQSYGGLAAGNYFARTTSYSGFLDELYNNISCPEQSCNPASGTPVPVSSGSDTGNIDFALQLSE